MIKEPFSGATKMTVTMMAGSRRSIRPKIPPAASLVLVIGVSSLALLTEIPAISSLYSYVGSSKRQEALRQAVSDVVSTISNDCTNSSATSPENLTSGEYNNGHSAGADSNVVSEAASELEIMQLSKDHAINTTNASNLTSGPTNDDHDHNDECFSLNSKRWLEGTRIKNEDDPLLSDELIQDLIDPDWATFLSTPPSTPVSSAISMRNILKQTVCHEDSRFLQDSPQYWNISDEQLIQDWEFRLTYLSIHRHYHAPAVPELKQRAQCPKALPDGIGRFDFECPDAKFLVTGIPPMGTGASFRLGAAKALLTGIAANRIVLFYNSLDAGPSFISDRLPLASCPRGDIQCVFLPTTPCTLTIEEIRNATVLEEIQARHLRRSARLDQRFESERVIIYDARLAPTRVFPVEVKIRNQIHLIARGIVEDIRQGNATADAIAVLEKAAQNILVDNSRDGIRDEHYYVYGNRHSKPAHAALFFLLRPNPKARAKIQAMVNSTIPSDLVPDTTFGLPIRGSDKCVRESTCLSFNSYLTLAQQLMNDHSDTVQDGRIDIILTTEDPRIMERRKAFVQNSTYPFRLISNEEDVLQGTGLPSRSNYRTNADQIMLISLVSLRLQLVAKYTVVNCCSNFHLLLMDFLVEGCGAANKHTGMCLQETRDPQFHVCCQWTKGEKCDQIRRSYMEGGGIKAIA